MMHKNLLNFGLVGILFLSSGCSVFKAIDKKLTQFGEALYAREQNRSENIYRRQGYQIIEGSDEVSPVQIYSKTNLVNKKEGTFLYSYNPNLYSAEDTCLTLSREFINVIGQPFQVEKKRIFSWEFSRKEIDFDSGVLFYTLKENEIKNMGDGVWIYEWWAGLPPDDDSNFFEDFGKIFTRDNYRLLMKGRFSYP